MSKTPFLTSACFALGLAAGDRGRTLSWEGWIGMDGLHGSKERKNVPKTHKLLIFYLFFKRYTQQVVTNFLAFYKF